MPTKENIKAFWDQAAEQDPYWFVSSYGRFGTDRNLDEFWESGWTIWSSIKRAIGYQPIPSHSVVEIGCGVGRLTRAISPDVGRIIALDVSEKMLAIARQANLPNVDFRTAQCFTLAGIPDQSVDLSLGYCVFQHLPYYGALRSYLGEMNRVTKPTGLMAFTLCPRDWKTSLLPGLRAGAYLREHLLRGQGPKGVYRKEWVGIRPSDSSVFRLSPIRLDRVDLGAERILYFGTC